MQRGNCLTDGCLDKPRPNRSRCPKHDSSWGQYASAHPERAMRYNSHSWRRRAKEQIRDHPDCAVCGKKATDADHVLAVALGGDFEGPLQSLCRGCHLRKTASDSKAAQARWKPTGGVIYRGPR
jgi:5-methylcytosine-specific restriction endonuclease McrA